MNPLLTSLLQNLPTLIKTGKELFMQANPGVTEPTDDEIVAGLQQAITSEIAKDDVWLAAHAKS